MSAGQIGLTPLRQVVTHLNLHGPPVRSQSRQRRLVHIWQVVSRTPSNVECVIPTGLMPPYHDRCGRSLPVEDDEAVSADEPVRRRRALPAPLWFRLALMRSS